MNSDKALKDMETRLKSGKVTGKEALGVLAKVLPLLRRRTQKVVELTAFVNGVSDEDRLYVAAWGIWRRKDHAKGAPWWARANPPSMKPSLLPEEDVADTKVIRVKGLLAGR